VAQAVPDMNEHTLTVTFDDARTSLAKITSALADAGFAVKEQPAKTLTPPPAASPVM
jgi:hypothetical protein